MYDELKERCRACSQGCTYPSECSYFDKPPLRCMRQLLSEAADAIENTSKAYKMMAEAYEAEVARQGWIPVSERLPETPGEYMVAYHPCYWDCVHDEIKVGLDSFRGKTSWAKKKYQRVTHWMPLPEPPKEE